MQSLLALTFDTVNVYEDPHWIEMPFESDESTIKPALALENGKKNETVHESNRE